MDEGDLSRISEEFYLAREIGAIRAAAARGEGCAFCEGCGEAIPDGRRQAVPGCTRCIDCQAAYEK